MKLHSVKLPHFSASGAQMSVKMPLPTRVVISMSQHGGVPCEPVVSVGDEVKTGQLIGDNSAMISAPVHSSVTGTVVEIAEVMSISGKKNKALVIETSHRQEMSPEVQPPKIDTREDFVAAVRRSGSVGLGGAGFPTHVKLNYDRKSVNIDTLIVNGAECEPYITSDYRAMKENPDALIEGVRLIISKLEIPRAIICIEADKSDVIQLLTEKCANDKSIKVKKLPSTYPQGAEKVMIFKATGRVLREGELPMMAGCLVLNCSTVIFINEYMKTGVPLIRRRLTIDGDIVNKPQNVVVPIGIELSELVKIANLQVTPKRIIFGGPMMGSCVYDEHMPVMKTNNAILFFKDANSGESTACIRCGRCIRACPMNLMPTELETAYDQRDVARLKSLKVNICMNCGACSYVCPAKRALSEKNQLAKLILRNS